MNKDFELAKIFQDNLVFQREKPIIIFGKAKKNINIKIEFLNYKYEFKTTTEEFCFTLTRLPIIRNGFKLRIYTDNQDEVLNNIVVGDVFLAMGQSNMAFTVGEATEIDIEEFLNIRSYEVPKLPYEGAEKEFSWLYQNNPKWSIANKESIKWFSALGYLIAKDLIKTYDIPIGIISCNMGDTTIFTWLDEQSMKRNPDFQFYLEYYQTEYQPYPSFKDYDMFYKKQLPLLMEFYGLIEQGVKEGLDSKIAHENAFKAIPNPYLPMGPKHQNRPSGLYEMMTKKIIPYASKAIIYYQGENDKLNYRVYKQAMDSLTSSLRTAFHDNLPMIIVQIAGYEYIDIDPLASSYLRTAQAKFLNLKEQKYVATAADLGEQYNIHPKSKTVLAKRISGILKEFIYHDNYNSLSPEMDSYRVVGNSIVIQTKNNRLNLVKRTIHKDYFIGITIDNHELRLSNYQIGNQEIIINEINNLKEIRYGYCNYPELFIYTENDLPLLPFRIIIE